MLVLGVSSHPQSRVATAISRTISLLLSNFSLPDIYHESCPLNPSGTLLIWSSKGSRMALIVPPVSLSRACTPLILTRIVDSLKPPLERWLQANFPDTLRAEFYWIYSSYSLSNIITVISVKFSKDFIDHSYALYQFYPRKGIPTYYWDWAVLIASWRSVSNERKIILCSSYD